MAFRTYGLQTQLMNVKNESYNVGIASQEKLLTSLLDEYHRERQRIVNDHRLTDSGKRERLLQHRDEALTRLNSATSTYSRALSSVRSDSEVLRGRLQSRLDFLPSPDGSAALVPRVAPADRSTADARSREIRDRLLSESEPLKRLSVALDAANQNDLELLSAIANAPRGWPILDDAAMAQVERLHISKHYGEVATQLGEMDQFVMGVEYNEATTRGSIIGDARRGPVDLIADQAA